MRLPGRLLSDWTRVVVGSVIGAWFGALLLFQAIDAFENLRDYGEAGARGWEIAIFFLLRSPEMALQILPAALLIGSLLGVFRLVRHRELTAAEAAGMHPGWLYAVPLGVALLMTGIQLALEAGPMPALRSRAERYEAEHILKDSLRSRREVRWLVAGRDLWRIRAVDAEAQRWQFERYARAGTTWSVDRLDDVRPDHEGNWHAGAAERLVWPPLRRASPAELPTIPFLAAEIALKPQPTDQLPLAEHLGRIGEKRRLGGDATVLLLDLHQRLSWPWLNLSVLLAVLPIVPRHGRRASTAVGVLVALVTGILGWAVVVSGQALATSSRLAIGYWLPHVLLALAGCAIVVRTWWSRRPRPPAKR